MSRNNDADIDPVPDEPPPPYEPLGAASSEANASTNHSASTAGPSTAATTNNAAASTVNTSTNVTSSASHNPFLAPEEHSTATGTAGGAAASPNPASNANPFSNAVTPQQTGASTTPTVTSTTPATAAQTPPLPPRNYAAPLSPAPSQPDTSRPSLDSRRSRHSRPSSTASAVSPNPTSPSIYAPPTGPPPPSSPASSSSANRPGHRRNDSYRPTTVPTPGQPLLRKGKILVYPRDWRGCIKCNDTGYKHGDPNNPHKSCWDKYGKTYTSAVSYSVGLNGATSHFQKPLPVVGGPPVGAVAPARPSHGHVPGGFPGAGAGGYAGPAPAPVQQGYAGYGPPVHAPPPHAPPPVSAATRPPRTPTTPAVDAETEGARMSDVPPNYHDASNVNSDERLPSQYVPPPVPPPGHGPPPPSAPHHAPFPPALGPYAPHAPPNGFVGGFGPNPGGPNPYVAVQPLHQPWYGARPPPPNALVVMPGDPRIGGRLCFECGGRGIIESFWLGDETCYRCRGSGRVF